MTQTFPSRLPFLKMHGLGNDFVVIDERDGVQRATEAVVRAMADRHRGVGFDQLAVMSKQGDGDVHLTFYNADGSTSAACGNATRCIARHIMEETGQRDVTLTTDRGTLFACDTGDRMTSVNMGAPQLTWQEVPLAKDVDLDALPIDGAPMATGMGNPHCTFFVENADAVDLESRGPLIENHPLFPQRTNVQFAHLVAPDHLRMRVWERGVGVTMASGSSSCATTVAAHRRGITGSKVQIDLDGGTIHIDWRNDGVWMTGPTTHVFDGVWHL